MHRKCHLPYLIKSPGPPSVLSFSQWPLLQLHFWDLQWISSMKTQPLYPHYFWHDFWNQFKNIHLLWHISFQTGFKKSIGNSKYFQSKVVWVASSQEWLLKPVWEKSSEIVNIFKLVSKVIQAASSQSDFWNQFENIHDFQAIFWNQFQKHASTQGTTLTDLENEPIMNKW